MDGMHGKSITFESAAEPRHELTFSSSPGRHLAAYEMKLMLAYILMTYDISFPPGQSESKSVDFWNLRLPNPSTNVMFRQRQTEVN